MMFFTGLNNTFYAAWFTRQIMSCHTGLVLLALGAGEMVGAYMAGSRVCVVRYHHLITRLPGKVADTFKNGQKVVLFSAAAMQAAALYLSVTANATGDYTNFFAPAGHLNLLNPFTTNSKTLTFCAALLGLADACFQPQVMSLVAHFTRQGISHYASPSLSTRHNYICTLLTLHLHVHSAPQF